MTTVAFAGSNIDRADHVRADPGAIEKLMTAHARLLSLDGLDPVVDANGALSWTSLSDASAGSELVFLGLEGDRGHFAQIPEMTPAAAFGMGKAWQTLTALSPADLATYGGARSLVSWHVRHKFCACCGSPTQIAKGGWQRDCGSESCAMQHFPRVDPVTIMLVEHDGNLLLGRQPMFPPGNYSALAGFVEPGETLEEAVARETLEEAGVKVRDVSYVVSQPWPFPSSLMIGCHALADDPSITIDETELDDARWFSRAEVADAIEASDRGEAGSSFQCPPRFAVANFLMRWWLDRG
ncbi:MAG: NAD(+) diphosphatase [Sphingomonadaceae bacterium]|nr:NAD(+) diphosphatase [Sphingomonadaceae bacterium]